MTEEERKGALRLQANNLSSCFLRNDGNGKFTVIPLPAMAQMSALNGMITDDFDNDGNLDVLINTNDYGTDVSIGRYDALSGLLLKGDGKGGFQPLSIMQSGINIPGNGKGIVKFRGADGSYMVAASQFAGNLKLFQLREKATVVSFLPGDASAIVHFKDGSVEKSEHYTGSSFLSQSPAFFLRSDKVVSMDMIQSDGKQRQIK